LKLGKFNYNKVEKIAPADYDKFGIESPLSLARNLRERSAKHKVESNKIYCIVIF